MLMQSRITAGRIMNYLEEVQRSADFNELSYFLEVPLYTVQVAVEILVYEGLAILDFDQDRIKLVKTPKIVQKDIKELQTSVDEMVLA